MNRKNSFIIVLTFMSIFILAEDKIVLKNGSFMSGDIKKVTTKGIKIEDKELGVLIDIPWSNISKKSRMYLINKYSMKEVNKPVKEKEPKIIEKVVKVKKIKVSVRSVAKKLFASYMVLVKKSLHDYALGFDVELVDGLKLHMKKGFEIQGELLSEDEKFYKISVKGRQKKITKELVHSSKKIKVLKRGGALGFIKENKKLKNELHDKIMQAIADDIGISLDSANDIFAKRLSGGYINDGKYNGKYVSYKFKSSVDFGKNSFLFSGKKGKAVLDAIEEEWWKKISSKEKANIYLGIYILNKLPKYKLITKSCTKCKGKGHLSRPKLKKNSKKTDRNSRKKTEDGEDKKICPDCRGLKNLLNLQYE